MQHSLHKAEKIILETRELKKSFYDKTHGNVEILKGINFSLKKSEVISIINCFNVGNVSSDSREGGILACVYDYSNYEIQNCFFGGSCTLNYGFGGYTNNNSPNNTGCTKISNLNSTSYAKNRNWYASSSNWNNTYPWDFNNVWSISSSQNNGYPYLNIRAFTYTIRYNIRCN